MTADLAHLRERIMVLAILSITLVATIATPVLNQRPLVVYNVSGSAPLGFYRVEYRLPRRGEMAVVKPPPTIETMLVERGFLPPGVPLIKIIAAVGGDRICRSESTITVNGEVAAEVLERDSKGRPLPVWEGCVTLTDGQFYLIQPHFYSFDSRYFGPVLRCDVIGVAVPLWTWDPPL